MACDHGMMLMSDHDDAYVDAMLMVNMQANTRSITRVYFPLNVVPTSLDTPYCLQTRISTYCSEGQQSVVTEYWYNLPSKPVPIYNVSCWLGYIAGKLFESSFTLKKRFIIWPSQ